MNHPEELALDEFSQLPSIWLFRLWIALAVVAAVATSAKPVAAQGVQDFRAGTLASKYPGDRGIGSDPSVVLYEDFDEGSVREVVARYNHSANARGMALVRDHPARSPTPYALRLTAGGAHPATDLYKSFGVGYDELFFRFYLKYLGRGPWHHSGVWIGGYNDPLPLPYPRAGLRPTGSDLYSIGLEPVPAFPNVPMDLYTYWVGMHSWRATPMGIRGDYFGNTLLHDAGLRQQSNRWICYEIHLKLNPHPPSGQGAVLEVWSNDQLIRRFDDRGPLGYWVRDKFCALGADGQECTQYRPARPALVLLDQRWRLTSELKINYFWPQNYNTASVDSEMLIDDIVVATQRVGCIG